MSLLEVWPSFVVRRTQPRRRAILQQFHLLLPRELSPRQHPGRYSYPQLLSKCGSRYTNEDSCPMQRTSL